MENHISTGHDLHEELKIIYNDDPDPEQAGQGLGSFPLIYQRLGRRACATG